MHGEVLGKVCRYILAFVELKGHQWPDSAAHWQLVTSSSHAFDRTPDVEINTLLAWTLQSENTTATSADAWRSRQLPSPCDYHV